MATGGEASRGSKPFAAAPRPEPMHGASSHPNPRNVASLRSRNQARFSCLISDSSLLLTAERRFAPTTVRYRRISVRYESEQVSAFIGIRTLRKSNPLKSPMSCGIDWGKSTHRSWVVSTSPAMVGRRLKLPASNSNPPPPTSSAFETGGRTGKSITGQTDWDELRPIIGSHRTLPDVSP